MINELQLVWVRSYWIHRRWLIPYKHPFWIPMSFMICLNVERKQPYGNEYTTLLCFYLCYNDINLTQVFFRLIGPRQANLVLIACASSEDSGEPAHPRSLARTFAARSYKQWIKRNFQTENQIRGPSEWLGMRSWNLSWRNARRHKFAWRGPIYIGKSFADLRTEPLFNWTIPNFSNI